MKLTSAFRRCYVLPVAFAMATLTGCASQTTHQELTPPPVQVAKQHPQSVSVKVLPVVNSDAEKSASTMAELRTALSDAIAGAQAFSAVKPEGGDYRLSVQIFNQDHPTWGVSSTAKLEMGWTLKRADTGAVIWQESIKSEHTTELSEAFVGAERARMATAGAIRENIRIGLSRIGSLDL